jgi:hypothetical protein
MGALATCGIGAGLMGALATCGIGAGLMGARANCGIGAGLMGARATCGIGAGLMGAAIRPEAAETSKIAVRARRIDFFTGVPSFVRIITHD